MRVDKNTTPSSKTSVKKKTTATQQLRHEARSPLVALVPGEVIEISSDEDERPSTRSMKQKKLEDLKVNHTPELRKRVKELETVRNVSFISVLYLISYHVEFCKTCPREFTSFERK